MLNFAAGILFCVCQASKYFVADAPNLEVQQLVASEVPDSGIAAFNFNAEKGDRVEGHVLQSSPLSVFVEHETSGWKKKFDKTSQGVERFYFKCESSGRYQIRVLGKGSFLIFLGFVEKEAEDPKGRMEQAVKLLPQNYPGQLVTLFRDGVPVDHYSAGSTDGTDSSRITRNSLLLGDLLDGHLTLYALLQLIDAGKLQLSTPLKDVLPELAWAPEIEIGHLCQRKTGLPSLLRLYQLKQGTTSVTLSAEQFPEFFGQLRTISFDVGVESNDVDCDLWLRRQVIERVSKMSFAEWMKLNVFSPCGMKTAAYYSKEAIPKGVVRSHGYKGEEWRAFSLPYHPMEWPILSMADWVAWHQSLLVSNPEQQSTWARMEALGAPTKLSFYGLLGQYHYPEYNAWTLCVNAIDSQPPVQLAREAAALLVRGESWKTEFWSDGQVGLGSGGRQREPAVNTEACQGNYLNDELGLSLQVVFDHLFGWEIVHPNGERFEMTPRESEQFSVRSNLFYQVDFVDFQDNLCQEIQLRGRDFARLKFRRVQ